ncbi:O-methyltransferase [Pseudohongiella sp.]|uniref:SAM-dependent methyltransferase n=1 Tax=marine sediment metagenome TaxID=412755 RepID=A0A0F9YF94_9ZZZZ|nr:class I SAM-dependent methyltransferase [Pseudohongiella sp.]HDZ08387.1 SAM-dependent methyltransferase [Pseudohongiella sp.]HEA62752.1 SAM-dependent methyltransferase [Pseudohongiella sp.]
MSRWIQVDQAIHDYIEQHLEPEQPVLKALFDETATLKDAQMQISHEQARFMSVVLRSMQVRHCIEIGVYTGYSTLITAQAMLPGGRIVACDLSEEWTAIAQRYWQQAEVEDRIDLRLAPASDTLAALLLADGAGQYDFVFIDADKSAYDHYYEQSLKLLRPGGLIMLDNCLWYGKVLDDQSHDEDTRALQLLNRKIANDRRVSASLVPIGDGIHMVYKL